MEYVEGRIQSVFFSNQGRVALRQRIFPRLIFFACLLDLLQDSVLVFRPYTCMQVVPELGRLRKSEPVEAPSLSYRIDGRIYLFFHLSFRRRDLSLVLPL